MLISFTLWSQPMKCLSRRKRGTLTSCAETKSKGEKLSFVCKTKNYWKSLVQAHALSVCVLQMGLKYRNKQGERTIRVI